MEGDKIGLQIGALNKPVQTCYIALDVTEEVVDEAIAIRSKSHYSASPFNLSSIKNDYTDKAWKNY